MRVHSAIRVEDTEIWGFGSEPGFATYCDSGKVVNLPGPHSHLEDKGGDNHYIIMLSRGFNGLRYAQILELSK